MEKTIDEIISIFNDKEAELKELPDFILVHHDNLDKLVFESYKTVKDFLISFFTDFNYNYNTCLSNGDKICGRDKRRSLIDLYKICLVYFPDLKIIDLLIELYYMVENKEINLCTVICPTINRRVYFKSGDYSDTSYFGATYENPEEQKLTHSKSSFTSPYIYMNANRSWVDILGHGTDEFELKAPDYVRLVNHLN